MCGGAGQPRSKTLWDQWGFSAPLNSIPGLLKGLRVLFTPLSEEKFGDSSITLTVKKNLHSNNNNPPGFIFSWLLCTHGKAKRTDQLTPLLSKAPIYKGRKACFFLGRGSSVEVGVG